VTGERIEVLANPDACSDAAAELIARTLVEAAAARGAAHWATTGGSTPAAIYRRLAASPLRDEIPWEQVQLWWGDDRFVPADHPLSNVHVATSDLLEIGALSGESGTGGLGADVGGRRPGAPLHASNVHQVPVAGAIARSEGPGWAAERYAEELAAAGPALVDGVPAFDLVLVGVGPDGHILSVFPGSVAFDRLEPALPIPAPTHIEPHVARVTLNPATVRVAHRVLAVVLGGSKAEIIGRLFGDASDPLELPAQLAIRDDATWILDEAAAAQLP
jgi:6-phosphogluconolactonase